jgi:hypothetical protein
VSSQQREAVLVILYLLHGNVPALNRMALRAVRAHLSVMHVRVAVLALLSNIRENRFHVALNALHFFVHSAQRISCLVVIEFGYGANRLPSRGRVTVLAGHIERAVRTLRQLLLSRASRNRRLPREQNQPTRELQNHVRNCPHSFTCLAAL